MLKSVKIPGKQVEVGYILAEDVYEGAVLMLRKGMVITPKRKNLLQNMKYVYVTQDEVDASDYKVDNGTDNKIVHFSEETKLEICTRLEDLYENVDSHIAVEAVAGLSEKIVNEVMSNDGVGINLAALKVSDEYTFKHSVDVAAMAIALGKNLGFSQDSLTELGAAGLLHDIGKMKIPDEILHKQGSLSDGEFRIMKDHPVYGYQILKDMDCVNENVRRAVLHHHERYYGGGYPANIEGKMIPVYARILCVVDVFDALVTDRPYHKARSLVDAIEIMYTMFDYFDARIFKSFLSTLIPYPVGSIVSLTNDMECRVIGLNAEYPLRPIVQDVDTDEIIDLANDLRWLSVMIQNPGFMN